MHSWQTTQSLKEFLKPKRTRTEREYPITHDNTDHMTVADLAVVDLLVEYPRVTAAMVAAYGQCSPEEALVALLKAVEQGEALALPEDRFTRLEGVEDD